MRTRCVIGLLLVVLGALPALAGDKEKATRQFAEGQALLLKGNFDQALAAFKSANKADPDSEQYFQEYSLLKRIMSIRAALADEKDADAFQTMARPVYAYYRDHKLTEPALQLATQMHAKSHNADSAVALADAQVAAGKNSEAGALLGSLPADQVSPHTQVLHGLVLARTGKLTDAKAVAQKLELPKDANADLYWDTARLYAAIGQNEKAIAALQNMFESTPPQQLAGARTDAKAATEFAKLVSTTEFAKALETPSKMAGCGGTSCAGCPAAAKGGCSKEKGDAAKGDAAAGCEHEQTAPAKSSADKGAAEKGK